MKFSTIKTLCISDSSHDSILGLTRHKIMNKSDVFSTRGVKMAMKTVWLPHVIHGNCNGNESVKIDIL